MKQYIEKSAVKSEIERRITAYQKNFDKADNKIARLSTDGRMQSLKELLSFIDTLEVKETGTVWHSFDEVLPQQGSDICVYWDRDEIITTGIWEESEKPKYASKWAYTSDLLKDK